jgi:hypothetical protein
MDRFFVDFQELLESLHRDFIATFEGLPQEALDWVPGEEMNSLCVLVVHTTGATRFWVGDMAMGESSNRDRAAEFQARGWSESALKERLASTKAYVRTALERLTLADLALVREVPGRNFQTSVTWALLHALEHTSLHLGHAQLTRQLWQQRATIRLSQNQ